MGSRVKLPKTGKYVSVGNIVLFRHGQLIGMVKHLNSCTGWATLVEPDGTLRQTNLIYDSNNGSLPEYQPINLSELTCEAWKKCLEEIGKE